MCALQFASGARCLMSEPNVQQSTVAEAQHMTSAVGEQAAVRARRSLRSGIPARALVPSMTDSAEDLFLPATSLAQSQDLMMHSVTHGRTT